ncbi:MAG: hypothetical protein AAF429_05070 [Pseudomonadota bacterium]
MERHSRTLAFAASTKRIVAVFLEDTKVVGWRLSRKAARNPKDAAACLKSWIDDFEPDLMISEDPVASHKGDHVKTLLETIGLMCDQADGLNVRLPRRQVYHDKYEEAKVLADKYPQLRTLVPRKPAIWNSEPHDISYFEALSYVEHLRQ